MVARGCLVVMDPVLRHLRYKLRCVLDYLQNSHVKAVRGAGVVLVLSLNQLLHSVPHAEVFSSSPSRSH